MKALRRSLKNEKESKAYHVSITPKSALAILPPKKVSLSQMEDDGNPFAHLYSSSLAPRSLISRR
jgi:hypothetical protein